MKTWLTYRAQLLILHIVGPVCMLAYIYIDGALAALFWSHYYQHHLVLLWYRDKNPSMSFSVLT